MSLQLTTSGKRTRRTVDYTEAINGVGDVLTQLREQHDAGKDIDLDSALSAASLDLETFNLYAKTVGPIAEGKRKRATPKQVRSAANVLAIAKSLPADALSEATDTDEKDDNLRY